jgi:hypothetical protein
VSKLGLRFTCTVAHCDFHILIEILGWLGSLVFFPGEYSHILPPPPNIVNVQDFLKELSQEVEISHNWYDCIAQLRGKPSIVF